MTTRRRMALMLAGPTLVIVFAALAASAEMREEFHKTVSMDSNGNFSLKNVNGGVTISAWDKNEVEIDAVKTGNSAERLREARIEVSGSGHFVDVETKYPTGMHLWPQQQATVEYTIHVPRGVRLHGVETVNGSVRIDGTRGSIKAHTVNGGVEVWNAGEEVDLSSVNGSAKATLNNPAKGVVRLKVVNGSVSLGIPATTNAHVKASTVNGGIQTDLPITVNRPQFGPGASIDTTMGSGGANIELETVNGSINLHKS